MVSPVNNDSVDAQANSHQPGTGNPFGPPPPPLPQYHLLGRSHTSHERLQSLQASMQQSSGEQRPEHWGQPPPKPKSEKGLASEDSKVRTKGTFESLKGGMQKVMDCGQYSDLTILCEDQKFSVHKAVVCSQSWFLEAVMKKGFKVQPTSFTAMAWWLLCRQNMLTTLRELQEYERNTIDLSDDGSLLVSRLVTFLYTGDYPPPADTSCVEEQSSVNDFDISDENLPEVAYTFPQFPSSRAAREWRYRARSRSVPLTHEAVSPNVVTLKPLPDYSLHVEMYALSDQHDIPALGTLAIAKLDVTCTTNWHPEAFLDIVPRVYESTLESNQGLRTVVVHHARKHSKDFMRDEKIKARFHDVLASMPEFSTALLDNYMSTSPPGLVRDGLCKSCGNDVKERHHSWCMTGVRRGRGERSSERYSPYFVQT